MAVVSVAKLLMVYALKSGGSVQVDFFFSSFFGGTLLVQRMLAKALL